ncbi:MAG: proteasome accessory factor PafA2 family protein [Candidatus Riflebacteria bacterium]|nr:proteasome accessory factor PafA2 family protein [Candidatus Riflebacteria bacterium]
MTEGARLSPRKGVLGLETEYAFVFTPEVGSSAPVQERIFEALSEVLKGQCTCQDAAYRKGGFFLANGGLLHYEAEADALHRGLLEMATPECSTVREALAHHRAQELVIARLLPGIRERLTKSSFAGTLVIGKASSDYQGHTFGTHENYLVEDRPGPVRLAALGLWIVVFQLVRLPLTLLYTGLTVLALVLFGLVFATTMAVALGQAIRRRPTGDEAVEPAMVRWLDRAIKGLVTVAGRLQILEHRYLLPPASRLVSPLLFHRFRDELVTFLVTRLVFTGPGWLRTDRPGEGARFVLSPKASAIGEVAQVYCDPAR